MENNKQSRIKMKLKLLNKAEPSSTKFFINKSDDFKTKNKKTIRKISFISVHRKNKLFKGFIF
jgi:hypothetical protein